MAYPLPPSPPFVTFEGIDGSGKSTAMQAVAQQLSVPVWTTREETERFGPAIRRSIETGRDPLVTAYLFLADRYAHAREIRRHLAAGETVLCDRFTHSTLAYQGVTLAGRIDDPVTWLRRLHEPLDIEPDIVLWLDLPPEKAAQRIAKRGTAAAYEKAGFLRQVQAIYARLADEDERIVRVDGARSVEQVAGDCVAAVQALVRARARA